MPLIPRVKKIAVLRSNAIGDYVVSLPALHALRQAYPQADITLLGQHWHEDFLKQRPGPVNRVVVVPYQEGIYVKANQPFDNDHRINLFFQKMRKEHFDLAIQLHGGGRFSNPFVNQLGAHFTCGMKSADAEPLDAWIPYVFYHYEVLRYLEVMALIGARPVDLEPRITVTNEDKKLALPFTPEIPFCLLHPGATDPRRRWPAEKFAAVGDALAKKGLRVLVTGNEDELHLAEAVCCRMKNKAYNTAGLLPLKALTGLLTDASLIVSNDTGPLHLARTLGTPTVGIYWIGNALNASPLSVAKNRRLISWQLNCPVCGKDCTKEKCLHPDSFVAQVDQEEVLDAALGVLEWQDLFKGKTKSTLEG